MISTFHSIETGKKSLIAQQVAVNITGNNISNVNNEKHSRVRINLSSDYELFPIGPSSPKLNGQIGSGSKIQSIERIRDMFLESHIIRQTSLKEYWSKYTVLLQKIESLYNEPSDLNLRTSFKNFVESWDKLSQYPTEFSYREVLKNRTNELTSSIQNLFKNLKEIQKQVDNEIDILVQEINHKAKQVSELNEKILALKAEGKSPNHLLDLRDSLIQDLSKIANIRISYQDQDDQVMLFIDSQILVQGKIYEPIKISSDPQNEGLKKLSWLNKDSEIIIREGKISSLFQIRDNIIPSHIKSLDHFSINLMELVNRLHEKGFGLDGNTGTSFFEKKYIGGTVKSLFDPNKNGDLSTLGLYRIEGSEVLKAEDFLGIRGTLYFKDHTDKKVAVEYFETDTVKDLIERINQSDSSVIAYLSSDGYLSFKVMPNLSNKKQDFFISYIEDTNVFLSDFSGIFSKNTSYLYDANQKDTLSNLKSNTSYYITPYQNPSSWISMDKKVYDNLKLIAVADGKDKISGVGDGRNALRILANLNDSEEYFSKEFREIAKHGFSLDKINNGFQDFLSHNLQKIASLTERADLENKKSQSLFDQLNSMRLSISGVNLNEEFSSLLTYQHAYHASAKFITYVDKMLETLIFKLGV